MESAMTFYQIKNKEKHFQKDLLLSVFVVPGSASWSGSKLNNNTYRQLSIFRIPGSVCNRSFRISDSWMSWMWCRNLWFSLLWRLWTLDSNYTASDNLLTTGPFCSISQSASFSRLWPWWSLLSWERWGMSLQLSLSRKKHRSVRPMLFHGGFIKDDVILIDKTESSWSSLSLSHSSPFIVLLH